MTYLINKKNLPSNAMLAAQISSTVNLSTRFSYFTGAPTRAPSNAHHQTTSPQGFVIFQPQRRSSANVPPSWHLQDANVPDQNTSHIFPFARSASPRTSSSQTNTNFHSHPVHFNCSISTSPAVHQDATLQLQEQVAHSTASHSLQPSSNFTHNQPSSLLRFTSSNAHRVTNAPPDAHHHIRPSQDFVGIQPRHILSPNIPSSLHFHATNTRSQNSSLNSSFACGAYLQIPASQTTTSALTQYHYSSNFHPARSFYQKTAATFYSQAQVYHSAASHSLQPPSNYRQTSPSSTLRVTFSEVHHVRQPLHCYRQHPRPPLVQVSSPPLLHPSHPHSFVEQNLPISQAQSASFESAHLRTSSNRTAACDLQGASSTPFHPPLTVSGDSHPMQRSTPSNPFPMFPPAWSDCQMPILPFHVVSSPEVCNIQAPTHIGANRSSTPRFRSHDTSSDSRLPTMQPHEDKRRETAGEIFSRACLVLR